VSLRQTLEQDVQRLDPGCFSLVMATGIVSIAAHLLEIPGVAWPLFVVALAAYAILCVLTAVRLLWYFHLVVADLSSHGRGAGFLTIVAATCILGSQCAILARALTAGVVFWMAALVLWCIVTYSFLAVVMTRDPKTGLETAPDGGWLVVVVATQAVSVLGTLAAPALCRQMTAALATALLFYLLGCLLYLLITVMIFHRLVFAALTPLQFTPAYWINMGAAAITTLAGATLVLNAARWRLIEELLPFLEGFALFFWIAGTWWIPLLVILEAWRRVYGRIPVCYDPAYWDLVFPLGMYATCTFELSKATGLTFLSRVSHSLGYVALLAWLAVFVGLLHATVRRWRNA
jgi:tellurite resistance protein TehA-like permease